MKKITSEIQKLVEENALALATINENGNPHCIAVGDCKVVGENQILVSDNYMKQTVENIKRKNNISLCVWNKNWEDGGVGYEFVGTTQYFTEGKWREMVKKINEGFPAKGAILVTVEEIKKLV